MKLKKIKIKNIRSYESQEVSFPEGSLLLAGDIGSGKTSLLLAIEYALFGLQPGQAGSGLLRNNVNSGEVILELEIDGREVIIERKLRRGIKSVTSDYASITLDGERSELSVTELKTRILQLLGYPSEFIKKNNLLYRYTVYTPQEQMKQIILEDAETRLNVLRHIFGIDKYKIIRENLSILLNKIKEDSKVLQGEIKSLDEEKNQTSSSKGFVLVLEQKIKDQSLILEDCIKKRKDLESQGTEVEQKIKEKEKYELELEKAKVMITSKRENSSHLEKEVKELQSGILELTKEMFQEKDLQDVIFQLNVKRETLEKLQGTYIETASQISSLNQKNQEIIKKKERVFSIEMCPTCLQDVPEVHKHNILNEAEQELGKIKNQISELEGKRSGILKDIEDIKKEKISLEDYKIKLEILKSKKLESEKLNKRLEDLLKNYQDISKDLILLTRHFESLKEQIVNFSKYTHLFKLKHEEIKQAFQNEKNAEISLAELKKEAEITNKEIILLEKKVSEKELGKKKLNYLLELHDWLSTQFISLINFTEQNVMLKLRLEFSKVFSKWFHIIGGEALEVQLDENFTPLIMQGDAEMDYSFLSGGERTAVALAYRLALNQTINSLVSSIKTRDIVILDEPTEGFSDAQIEKIREVLVELNVKQLVIVSHEQKIEGFVDNVYRLKKDGDSSYIETIPAG